MDDHESPESPRTRVSALLSSRPVSPVNSLKPLPSVVPPDEVQTEQSQQGSLGATVNDLQNTLLGYTRLLPFLPHGHPVRQSLKAVLAPPVNIFVRALAKVLHSRGILASQNLGFDLSILFWRWIINLFFREIKTRGGYRIPKDGALIFVAAPHNNQFVDPIMLWSEARFTAGRRVSFITAASSMKRKFIGAAARVMQSIPVERAADSAKKGHGIVYLSSDAEADPTILLGHKTQFTKQFGPKSQIMLPKAQSHASAEIVEVIDDTHLKLKKPFDEKASKALQAAGDAIEKGVDLGITFKAMPYIDQTSMYASVYQKLSEGGCIGIFPEGGSHDRTDLLPLKAGVSIMALGALSANPTAKISIIPTGLSYFHAHRFRSRAVVEFGAPITIPHELVELFEKGGQNKRDAIAKVLDLVFDGLKSVTVRAPNYEALMLIQATRRLYRPPGQNLSLGQVVELNKRFIIGYDKYKDEPRVIALSAKVAEYNKLLRYMGLKDHQVEHTGRPVWRSLSLLIFRSLMVTGWGLVTLPGLLFNAPMFIAATLISRRKAKEALAASTVKIQAKDVVATWKILVSLGLSPLVYIIYGILAIVYTHRRGWPVKYQIWIPFIMAIAVPSIGYSALKFGETGMDIYKSLRPLFVTLMPGNQQYIDRLKRMRAELSSELSNLVEEFGPQLFNDFASSRVIPASESRSSASRRSTFSKDQGLFTHPFEVFDSWLFGWTREVDGSSAHSQPASTLPSGMNTPLEESGEEIDYDQVVSAVHSNLHHARKRSGSPHLVETEARTTALDESSKEGLTKR